MTVDNKWFAREQWTLIEAAQICAGINPYQGGPATDNPHVVLRQISDVDRRELFNELYARSKDAISQHSLALGEWSRTGGVGNRRVRPFDYVIWVLDIRLPTSMDALIDKTSLAKVFGEKPFGLHDNDLEETDLGFTIRGAAHAIHVQYEINESALCGQIHAAARAQLLPVINPETRMPYVVTPTGLRDFYDRLRTADLNKWFEDNGAPYRLGSTKAEASAAGSRGVHRNQIIDAFKVRTKEADNKKFWNGKLGRPPGWLKGALVVLGKRGVSSTWNPSLVAHALLEKRHMTLRALDSAMKNFPTWMAEWESTSEMERE